MSHKVARFVQKWLLPKKPYPAINWNEVIRIEAMGTDAFSSFQVWLTFTHSNGSQAEVAIETKGYWDIVESLHVRFPSISPTWYEEMSQQPWHVERVLYVRDRASDRAKANSKTAPT